MRGSRTRLLVGALATLALMYNAGQADGGVNQWTPLGLNGAYGVALATDPRPAGPIYLGTLVGLYRSVDDGATWQIQPEGVGTPTILSLAVDPATPATVYAGTSGDGVWKSTDEGVHWSPTAHLTDGVVRSIAIDSTGSTLLIATGASGVFRSNDAGATWTENNDGLPTRAVNVVTIVAGTTMAHAASRNGLFLSSDLGAHWQAAASNPTTPALTAFAVDSTNHDLWFAGTLGAGLFRSSNAGVSWQPVLTGQDILGLAIRPGTPSQVYAATGVGLFLSLNDGVTFTYTPTLTAPLFSLAVQPAATGRVFVGTLAQGVYRSAAGDAAQLELANVGLLNVYAGTFRFDATANRLLAGTAEGVWQSNDGGGTWNRTTAWTGDPAVFALLVDAVNPALWYVGVQQDGIFLTPDAGGTWQPANSGLVPRDVLSLDIEPSTSTVAYAGSAFRGVFRTVDGGAHWSRSGLQGDTVFDLAAIRSGFIGLFAATASGLWFSVDFAANWTRFETLPEGPVLGVTLTGELVPTIFARTAGGLYRSPDAGFSWARVPIDDSVLSVAADPNDPQTIYVGTLGGVLRSRDGGVTFESRETLPTFYATALLATGVDTAIAGTPDGVFRSTDGAATWTRVARSGEVVSRLVATGSPASRILAVAGPGGLFRSDDGGESFVRTRVETAVLAAVGMADTQHSVLLATRDLGVLGTTDGGETTFDRSTGLTHFVQALAADPADPNQIWAGTLFGGLYRSSDRGGRWEARGLQGRVVTSVLPRPGGRAVVLAGTQSGVFLSHDDGRNWARSGIDTTAVLAVAALPTKPVRIYVGAPGGTLFTSNDGGELFNDASEGFDQRDSLAFAGDPFAPGVVFAATDGGVYRSRGPTSWMELPGMHGRFTQAVATDPARNGSIYAGTRAEGLFWSGNGGDAWYPVALPSVIERNPEQQPASCQLKHRPCHTPPRTVLSIATTRRGTLFVGTENGLYRSNEGLLWKPAPGPLKHGLVPVVVADPSSTRTAYAISHDGVVFRTTDLGQRWRRTNTGIGKARITVLHHTARRRFLLAASDDGRLFRTSDGGRRWTSFDAGTSAAPVRGFASNPDVPDEIYLATADGLYVSTDGGTSWRARRSGLGGNSVQAMIEDPSIPGGVYAATIAGVFHSADAGVVWEERNEGLAKRPVFALAAPKEHPGRLFAATADDGVYRSDDDGRSWRPMNEGLPFRIAVHLGINPTDPDTLLVGCEGGGIHQFTVAP